MQSRRIPKQSRSKATVNAILIAAAQILVEEGYEHTNTNRVAERAGVSIGSLYQYFPNKEALVTALAERHMARVLELIDAEIEAAMQATFPEAVRTLVRALLQAHAVDPQLHRVLIEQVPRIAGVDPIRRGLEAAANIVRGHLEQRRELLRPQNLDLAVFILVHSVQAVTHAAVLERPDALADEALASETANMVLRYLMPASNEHVSHAA